MIGFNEILVIITLWVTTSEVSTTGCHCPGGCPVPPVPCSLPCERGWSGPFCQKLNIALGKATEQTGSFNDTAYCPPPDPRLGPWVCGVKGSDLAVDGDTDHTYWHGSCSHTIPHNSTARWSVDLVGSHLVSHLEIHLDEDQQPFLNTFTVTVDGQWCQNWTQSGHKGLVADITCSRPLHGSNLTIQSFPDHSNRYQPMLDLCEVEVFECSDFWFGVDCDKQCHCRNKTEVCDKVTGQCASGCSVARIGSDCQLVDIAYKKPTLQSSSAGHGVKEASLTVDGDPSTCQKIDLARPLTFWSVDLAKTADISRIRINSQNNLGSSYEFNVTVDGKLCFVSGTSARVLDIKCQGYLAGSNVSIVMTSSGRHSLDLCEVEVFECADYTYGANCNQRCNCRDVTEVCNKATGHCDSGCPAGWTGVNCRQAHPHAIVKKSPTLPRSDLPLSSTLDDVTSCPSGHYGPDCSVQCGHCSPGSGCDPITGHCEDKLCSGFWVGPRCDECRNGTYNLNGNCISCSTCINDTCNTRNGRCNFGCKPGYLTPMCNKECPFKYFGNKCYYECGSCQNNQTCHHITGRCENGCAQNFTGTLCNECVVGNYGRDCDKQCGECQNTNSCDKQSGRCAWGCRQNTVRPLCQACPRGKYGPTCEKDCGLCKYRENCDRISGVCTVGCQNGALGKMCDSCAEGFYGDGCFQCGHCAHNLTCDITSGNCSGGCASGWAGQYCNMDCPQGFYGHDCSLRCGQCKRGVSCDSRSGHCPGMACSEGYMGDTCKIECRRGTFGPNCRFPCGHCLHNVTCDMYNGSCPRDRCMTGYVNPRCQRECPDGYYGNGCVYSCENCETGCDLVTGICKGACVTGWSGEMCMEAISDTKPGVVAAAVIVPLIVLGIVAVLLFLWWRRRRRQKSDKGLTDSQRDVALPYLGRERRTDIQMGGRFADRESDGMINEGFRGRDYAMPRRVGTEREEDVIEEYAMPRFPTDTETERRMNEGFRRERFSDKPLRSGREKEEEDELEYAMPRGPSDRETERRMNEGSMDDRNNMPQRERGNKESEERERGYNIPRRETKKGPSRDARYNYNEAYRGDKHDDDARLRDRYHDNDEYRDRYHDNDDYRERYHDNDDYRDRCANVPRKGRYDEDSDEEQEDSEQPRFPDVQRNQRTYENVSRGTALQNPRTDIQIDDRRQRPSMDIQEHGKRATNHRDDIQTGRRARDIRSERSNDVQYGNRSVDI